LDVDNDSAFMNETVLAYCGERGMQMTRSRAYQKNGHAWIEQKNGAVARKLVGDGRLEAAATALGSLHELAGLYVNFFQPSAKSPSKKRQGARVLKWHDVPATPFSRLLASDCVGAETKHRLQEIFDVLDPVHLLAKIRQAQQRLAALEVGRSEAPDGEKKAQDLDPFLQSLENCGARAKCVLRTGSLTKDCDGALDGIRYPKRSPIRDPLRNSGCSKGTTKQTSARRNTK
jgi:hypothetical protein